MMKTLILLTEVGKTVPFYGYRVIAELMAMISANSAAKCSLDFSVKNICNLVLPLGDLVSMFKI